ncbi:MULTISPECIES: hypothetical protein [Pseudomonas syringae group genomosp. 2]|uniref:hypothetical protein n=1 Tax=Pseudomonas syringae group genomosp. 2 TaxID=251698 RepID=UPI0006D64266|nr:MULTISPECIES: hypothetical protein [Pseudomonas syringae group genomosp. 2]KPX38941.1 Uncharacterized protein ALO69_02873 [Pseudomonas ficuserectae]RMS31616.1 hypothetical protein ALP68_03362 [Pseudomonas ficuserectae]RMS32307.1 hypothetical protein ALP67_03551 [Pseudomonas ficuserectae]
MANTEKAPSTAKAAFEEAQNSGLYPDSALSLGSEIYKQITSLTTNNALSELQLKLSKASAAAAASGSPEDEALVDTLYSDLKKARNDQKNVKDQYKAIRGSNTFETILLAYGDEFRELASKIALEVTKGTHLALKNVKTRNKSATSSDSSNKGTGGTRTPTSYTITNDKGETTVLVGRAGRAAANLTQDADTFAFLGFTIETDEAKKEHLNPATIKLSNNTEIPATRPNIVRAIQEPEQASFKGYTATEIK